MLADFHIHTTFSDGKLSLREVVDLFGRKGFGVIAITDHLCEEDTLLGRAALYLNKTLTRQNFQNYIDQIKEEAERAWKLYKMLVLPGYEITKNSIRNHRSAHILAIGVEEYIPANLDVVSTSRKIKSLGGISVAAHPISMGNFRKGNYFLWDQRFELEEEFDAWEITDNGYVLKDVLDSKLPKIANSDFHSMRQLKAWRNEIYTEKNPQAVLDAVRNQKLKF